VALAVCLLFDPRSERAVRALWDRLERVGVPSLRSHTHGRHLPHVSYAVLRSWELSEVSAALLRVGGLAPVELASDGIGLFRRGRAWLLAGGSAELHARQERVVLGLVLMIVHTSAAKDVELPVLRHEVYTACQMPRTSHPDAATTT
jgi:hypothetical protein